MTQVSRRDPGCHCAVEDPLQGVQAWLMDAGCSRSFPKAADPGGEMLCSGAEITVAKKCVEGEAPSSETGTSLDSPSAYQGPLAPGSSLSPDHYEHTSVGAYGLYAGPPGQQQRTRRPKLQHSTSILRKQAEEEAIKRSRSLSESYELSSDLQDKQVGGTHHAGTGSQAALPGGRRAALCWDCLGQQESRLSDTGVLRSPTDGSMVMRTCATTVTFASAQAALPAPPDPWRLSE
uniref:IQ motif and SEC7 domain-containing protein 1 isoform X2 n=1 Tax=Panthera onca TaxID=9690 RepID=UPI002952E287|nr:IQ motif and SEC7 domain-containing protein 1 isoform X2 [Panthera onca]